jgi:choice-of-anchor A domain-containing protein
MKRYVNSTVLIFFAVCFCYLQSAAQSPTAPAQGFNVFLKNNATFTQSESEGPVALGGNLTLAGSYNFAVHNNFVYQVSGQNIALLVGGRVYYSSGNQGGYQVLQGGYVKIGDSTGSRVWYSDPNASGGNIHLTPNTSSSYTSSPDIELNSTASSHGNVSSTSNPVFQGGLIDFNAAFTTLQTTSSSLSTCTDNITLYNSPNSGSTPISHSGISSGTQIYTTLNSVSKTVLNIAGSDLNNISSITFQNPNGSTQSPDASHILIVNVNASGSFTWSTPNGLGNTYAPYIIWNFYNTTTLTIGGNNAVEGAVFAPFANISKTGNNANIEGQLIGLSYYQSAGGEIHSYNITQTVAGCGTPTAASFTINTTAQCLSGNSFIFTNTSTGTSNTYVWNFGDNTATSTSTSPTHTYASAGTYTVKLKATGNNADSITHTVTVNPTVTPSVTISANPGSTICSGTSVTFTATASSATAYQWKKNGNNVGTNINTYTDASLNNNDAITCTVTSSATCASANTATSSAITMTVNPTVAPSVTVSANPGNNICSGTSVTFTATASNATAYQWKKNGNNVGTNSNTYTDASLNNNDAITCTVTSSATCASPNMTTSSTITITVNPTVAPSVTISANPGSTICSGTSVTFTATASNATAYQWKKNGNNVGTNSNAYTDASLNNNDAITCTVTSGATCASPNMATSNTITINVNGTAAQPGAFTVSSPTVYDGQANVTYTVPSVSGTTYNWSYSGTGATITGTGNSVTVTFSPTATSGTLSVTAVTSGCTTSSAARQISITVDPYITWTCTNNNDWNNAANWDGGFIPYSTISVFIPATANCQPSVCTGSTSVYNMTVGTGATVNICCGNNITVNNSLTNNGSILGCGHIIIIGTTCQVIRGNGRVDNFELNNSCGGIINAGDTLHIGHTYVPTNGVLTINGELELLSDPNYTAEILTHPGVCSNYIVGDVICDKYIHGTRRAFRFFGHPFTTSIGLDQLEQYFDITGQGGAANGFTPTNSNNPSAFWYNTSTGNGSTVNDSTGWTAFTNTNGAGANAWNRYEGMRALVRGSKGQGLGCGACVPDPITLKMHGPINECDQTVTLVANNNTGFNFISNPYASNIDINLTTRGNAIGANFCTWDPNQGLVGAYVDQPFGSSYILPAYSSFFTTCNGNSGKTITFHEGDKTSATPTGNLFKTTGNDNLVQLRILSGNDSLSWDRILLYFNDNALAGTDEIDGTKFGNPDLNFYSFSADNDQLAIDRRPYVSGQVIKLGLTTDVNQDYSIRVDNYTIPTGGIMYLHDKYLNKAQQLSNGMRYSFTVTTDAASQGDNRFELNLNGTTGITNVPAASTLKVDMFPNPATDNAMITFEAPHAGNTILNITNLVGQQIFTEQLGQQQSGKINLPMKKLPGGIYMVTLKCGDLSITKRLVKQ